MIEVKFGHDSNWEGVKGRLPRCGNVLYLELNDGYMLCIFAKI